MESGNKKRIKFILVREVCILLSIIALGYLLDAVYYFLHRGPLGPSMPFWKDPYFYRLWENPLRENAQIIRFLGYPFYLLILGIIKFFKLSEAEEAKKIRQGEEEAKKIIEEIVKELKWDKELKEVKYRQEFSWYVVRFEYPPSYIIPKILIDKYIASRGKAGRREIMDLFLS
ncbi:MAG: hypothetical protein GF375_01465 [Candidatus Omnitrophica bacterium]|nr:hypothetical protein [Candidatus Omnitrophota bacterium]MBD3268799.1 hypothetical protein [Candidatus Omnitrophota bacterium]